MRSTALMSEFVTSGSSAGTRKVAIFSKMQEQSSDSASSKMASSSTCRSGGHRRAQSEIAFHLPDDIDIGLSDFKNESSENFMVACKKNNEDNDSVGASFHSRSFSVDEDALWGSTGPKITSVIAQKPSQATATANATATGAEKGQSRHRHSMSMDGSSSSQSDPVFSEVRELKKAMAADKLAELAAIDPKRAKRILANRQSAARSKERKLRYISDLERKVQTLQAEATTLSAQLALFQRDTTELTTENEELKLRLQAMDQQAQLLDDLNNALRDEIHQLRIATCQLSPTPVSNFCELQETLLDQSFFSFPEQSHYHTVQQLQQLHLSSTTSKDEQVRQFQPCSEYLKYSASGTMHGIGGN